MNLITPLVLVLLALPLHTHAAAVSGVSGMTQFENYRDNFSGNYIDFTHGTTPMPADRRLDSEFTGSLGVTFSTFLNPNLTALGPHNVYVSTGLGNPVLVDTIVGTPCVGCQDDGRYSYQIEFINPQRYAGVERIWNEFTRTKFYTATNGLLHEGLGTGFHGYEADSTDTATWINRIEITAITDPGGTRQVGYTDDLFFGTLVPEPGSLSMLGLSALGILVRRSRL